MRIGRIHYLNVLPFYHALDEARWGPWVDESPRRLGILAREGQLDCAPLPIIDTFDLEDDFEPLGNWGIACRGAVGSVLLFSSRPFRDLSGARLLFTGESATSVVLARLLLDDAGVRDVRIEQGDDPQGYDGYLAIGDRALTMVQNPPFTVRTDLCEEWYRRMRLPFVFERWVVRRTITADMRTAFEQALAESIARPLPASLPNQAGLSDAAARDYLDNMIYRLDADCMAAVDRFRSRVHVLA